MGIFDHEVDNSFEHMFDYNHDGSLDPLEQGIMFQFLDSVSSQESEEEEDE